MTLEERFENFKLMLGNDEVVTQDVFEIYLRQARRKILNHRYPYGTSLVEVEPRFEEQLLELTVVLYNQRGGEGQERHVENGVTREWRSVNEILSSIPRMVGIPK